MDAKDKRIAELERRDVEREALFQAALARIAELESLVAKLQKRSGNSSKPPSSDIVKPPKQKDRRRKKKIGGQKGHKQHLRTPFHESQINKTVELKLEVCPKCSEKLKPAGEPPKRHQQVELIEKSFIVTEYRQHQYWCNKCQCCQEASYFRFINIGKTAGEEIYKWTQRDKSLNYR